MLATSSRRAVFLLPGSMRKLFRFFLICKNIRTVGESLVFDDIFDCVIIPDDQIPCDVKCHAVIGCVLDPELQGKRLILAAWKLNAQQEPEDIPGWPGTVTLLPRHRGPITLEVPISVPILTSGWYGFYLIDADGAFGKAFDQTRMDPEADVLASSLFGLFGESAMGPVHLK